MILTYSISDVAPYINWPYFYFAWQVKQPEEQARMRKEAEAFLAAHEGRYKTYAVFLLVNAHADGDNVVVDLDDGQHETVTLPFLRQQQGNPCLCLSDFVHPQHDRIGLFATSVDSGLESDFDADPYMKMMAQLLADRLAEATAERMHEQVRKYYWGYAPDEQLSIEQLHKEEFQGIRPAVGYPSLPDQSVNFLLDQLLDMLQIGIMLTENGAMNPHASVSGLMFAHPQARYFSVGKIGEDQFQDYVRRRGLSADEMRKFLAACLE
jgi:cobalamin-dependent methionine synthase I